MDSPASSAPGWPQRWAQAPGVMLARHGRLALHGRRVIKLDEDTKNYKLEFDFGDDKKGEESGEQIDFSAQQSLGACRQCGAAVYEHGKNYVCDKSEPTMAQPTPTCDFKSGQVILQQPIARKQMSRLLETGKTDLLDKFVSMRTRRGFKAMLAWDAEAGKVNFEFAPRKFAPRKTAAASASKPVATNCAPSMGAFLRVQVPP